MAAPYGAPGNHWICDLTLLTHVNYLANSFDVVIINGVFNYGINKLEDKKNALFTAQTLLKDEGVLLIGYRDKLPNRDFTPDMMEGLNFLPCAIPGLEREYVQSGSANGHAFSGYKKLGSVIAP